MRMTKDRVIGALWLVLLCGCAQTQLVNPNVTSDQARMDDLQCKYESERAAPLTSSDNVFEIAMARNEIKISCLKERGYVEKSKY